MAEPAANQVTMLEAIELVERPITFFKDKYFGDGTPIETKYVKIERHGTAGRGMSFFANEYGDAHALEPEIEGPDIYATPLIAEKRTWHAEQLADLGGSNETIRREGEAPRTFEERMIANDAKIFMDRCLHRIEYMCIGAMMGGWVFNENGIKVDVDFAFPAANKVVLTGGDRWGEAGVSIASDIKTRVAALSAGGGGDIQDIVFGRNAFARFAGNEEVQDEFDRLNWRVGQVDLTFNRQQRGTYNGANIYEVTEQVLVKNRQTGAVTTVDLVNPEGVWFVGANFSTQFVFGRIAMFDKDVKRLIDAVVRYYYNLYVTGEDSQTLTTLFKSRPMPLLSNNYGVVYLVTR